MTRKSTILSSVAASALLLGFVASPASAFDQVNWSWNLTVDEKVKKNVTIDVDVDPKGLVLLENVQVQVGDVKAVSNVSNVKNNQPTAGGPTTVDLGTLTFSGNYHPDGSVTGTVSAPNIEGETFLGGTYGLNDDTVNANVDLGTVEVQADPSQQIDARTQLPEVVSAATAVGNNSSIESDVMVEVHEGQFLFDLPDNPSYGNPQAIAALAIADLFDSNYGDVNTNHLVGAATLIGAVGGLIDKAEVSAVSRVDKIVNASVDSAATAVGNNKSITIGPMTRNDAVFMGDITQVSIADISAKSSVSNVALNNYTNLGKIDRPIVNSVATAVGNNLSVTLKNGALDINN